MPTLNEYANKDGYYILARPSDTGNITYQLKPRGEQIVEKVGYQDGEEIGWQVISALKVPNLVYTGDEGTTDDNLSVNLDNEEIDALSKEDAKKLLDELSSVPRVGDSQTDEIRDILNVPPESEESGKKQSGGSSLQELFGTSVDIDEVSTNLQKDIRETKSKSDQKTNNITIETIHVIGEDVGSSEEERDNKILYKFKFLGIYNQVFFSTCVNIRENIGISVIKTEIDTSLTVEKVSENQKFIAKILPIITSELESAGINWGSADSLPAPAIIGTG